MITWNNLDTLESFKELSKVGRVDIKEAMSGDNGAKRVKEYNIPMAEGFTYNFAAKHLNISKAGLPVRDVRRAF